MNAAHPAPPGAAPPEAARAVRLDPPPPTAAARVWFGWLLGWTALFSATLSPGLVLQSASRPTAETFRAWMRPWARAIFACAGIRLRVVERAALPDGPVVFVANHQNAIDIPATSVGLPRPFLYVARHELRAWPIVGWVLEKSACIFIRRDNPREALKSLGAAADRVRAGESVLLFPEGGRSHGHALAPFMRGPFLLAIEAGVPIVPVALVGHTGVADEKALAARPGEVHLVLGTPIPTAGLRRRDAGELGERVRAALEAELGRYGTVGHAAPPGTNEGE
ncbi:lysophospholipid acyltransferase family protein [Rubrivirga sp. S365]|uniref:Lysophospholipid acyltransferase family protein n=1 Tax=Rubrivirga litoralis TaxID=3075598 RepID=A0ABU3BUR2_9BACT|nr:MULTISPECIES: lysophospholipid acyltransferase family protein [unclassified Rubrivirga]MDT0632975.1 lysophospholipid acyltransferase family protein [Rubrivirga sp. F394]MDT7856224.1 lysophospholipid acyltransferase family protein [Rubrivirga sp. S365]